MTEIPGKLDGKETIEGGWAIVERTHHGAAVAAIQAAGWQLRGTSLNPDGIMIRYGPRVKVGWGNPK